jgi:hypothetical protein
MTSLVFSSQSINKSMNRNSLLPMITVLGCICLATGVNAQNATSTNSSILASGCSIKAFPGTLAPNTNLVNGVNFPTELTSNASPGKFSTLCTTATNVIKVQRLGSVTAPGDQGGVVTYSYDLSATGTSAYIGNLLLGTNITGTGIRSGSISHGFTQTASDLIVSVKAKVATGYILGEGDYAVSVKATLTP